jgi:hypothetical protein
VIIIHDNLSRTGNGMNEVERMNEGEAGVYRARRIRSKDEQFHANQIDIPSVTRKQTLFWPKTG